MCDSQMERPYRNIRDRSTCWNGQDVGKYSEKVLEDGLDSQVQDFVNIATSLIVLGNLVLSLLVLNLPIDEVTYEKEDMFFFLLLGMIIITMTNRNNFPG